MTADDKCNKVIEYFAKSIVSDRMQIIDYLRMSIRRCYVEIMSSQYYDISKIILDLSLLIFVDRLLKSNMIGQCIANLSKGFEEALYLHKHENVNDVETDLNNILKKIQDNEINHGKNLVVYLSYYPNHTSDILKCLGYNVQYDTMPKPKYMRSQSPMFLTIKW